MLSTNEPIWKEYNILKSFLSGTDPDAKSSRQDVCTRSSLSSMGLLVGHFFLKDAFSTATKMQASELVEGVVQAFTERLKRVDWLDEPTRQRAIKKVSLCRVQINFVF